MIETLNEEGITIRNDEGDLLGCGKTTELAWLNAVGRAYKRGYDKGRADVESQITYVASLFGLRKE